MEFKKRPMEDNRHSRWHIDNIYTMVTVPAGDKKQKQENVILDRSEDSANCSGWQVERGMGTSYRYLMRLVM